MGVSFYSVKWIRKTLQSLDTALRIMPEHLTVTYETPHKRALATFPVPPPVILMLGHDTQATEVFLPATLVCQAISLLGPSVSLPPAEMLCPPHSSPLNNKNITWTLLLHRSLPSPLTWCPVTLLGSHGALYLFADFITTAIIQLAVQWCIYCPSLSGIVQWG